MLLGAALEEGQDAALTGGSAQHGAGQVFLRAVHDRQHQVLRWGNLFGAQRHENEEYEYMAGWVGQEAQLDCQRQGMEAQTPATKEVPAMTQLQACLAGRR